MKGTVNGFGTNGAALPNWVVRAVVVAVAAATVTVGQTRTTYASCYGDAAVSVTLTQTHTIQARATGTAVCGSNLTPHVVYAGHANVLATATGNGAVRRDVFGEAGGDARATGEALTAQAIGTASATAASTTDLALAHLIRPGRAIGTCAAAQSIEAGDVNRYARVTSALGTVTYTRGEASTKSSGASYFRHDGYVVGASSTCTAQTLQDRTVTIATLGSFVFGESVATSRAFITEPGRALGTGVCTATQVVATHIYRGRVNATSGASADITGVRNVLPVSTAAGEARSYNPIPRIKHASAAASSAQASSVDVIGKRTAYGHSSGTVATAYLVSTTYGAQARAETTTSAQATSNTPNTLQRFAGRASVIAEATANTPVTGRQYRADSSGFAVVVEFITPTHRQVAFATGTATGFVGRAYGLANSDVLAPDDRYMIVGAELRGMTVFTEDRTMRVAA